MALSHEVLARRIRDALDRSGMSQRILAEYVDMDETALSKALAGKRSFRSLEVARIAERLNLRTDVLFADNESQYEQTMTMAARLQEGAAGKPAVAEAVGLATEMWELDRLLTDVDFPATDEPSVPSLPTGDAVKQGNELAHQVLIGARQGDEPLPVDIEDLALWMERNLYVDICITPFPTGVDGLALTRGGLRLILVSSNVAATRQRFTMAHELCHVLTGDAQNLTVDEDVQGPRQNSQERRANAFAAAFLLPAAALRATLAGRRVDSDENVVVDLLGRYGVSLDVLAYRLHNLGIVNAASRDAIRAMTSARIAARPGRSDDLRARNERRTPTRLLDRALRAFASGHMGIRPLANLLKVDADLLLEELTPPRFKPWNSSDEVVLSL